MAKQSNILHIGGIINKIFLKKDLLSETKPTVIATDLPLNVESVAYRAFWRKEHDSFTNKYFYNRVSGRYIWIEDLKREFLKLWKLDRKKLCGKLGLTESKMEEEVRQSYKKLGKPMPSTPYIQAINEINYNTGTIEFTETTPKQTVRGKAYRVYVKTIKDKLIEEGKKEGRVPKKISYEKASRDFDKKLMEDRSKLFDELKLKEKDLSCDDDTPEWIIKEEEHPAEKKETPTELIKKEEVTDKQLHDVAYKFYKKHLKENGLYCSEVATIELFGALYADDRQGLLDNLGLTLDIIHKEISKLTTPSKPTNKGVTKNVYDKEHYKVWYAKRDREMRRTMTKAEYTDMIHAPNYLFNCRIAYKTKYKKNYSEANVVYSKFYNDCKDDPKYQYMDRTTKYNAMCNDYEDYKQKQITKVEEKEKKLNKEKHEAQKQISLWREDKRLDN